MNNGAELEYSGFGNLVRDDEYGWCKGTISFPSLAACRILFDIWWDGRVCEANNPSETTGSVPIVVLDTTNCIPSPAQNAAHLYLMQNQDEILSVVLQALNTTARSNVEEVRKNVSNAEILERFNHAITENQLDTVEGVKKQVELIEIGFLGQEKNKHAYVSLDFNCSWDNEHGTSVLMHKNQVLAISGCADFYDHGEGLEAHVELLQSLT
jgi:hypothetical protein